MFKSLVAGIIGVIAALFGIHSASITPTALSYNRANPPAQLAASAVVAQTPNITTSDTNNTTQQVSNLSSASTFQNRGGNTVTKVPIGYAVSQTLAQQITDPFVDYATLAELASTTAALQSEIAALNNPVSAAQIPQQVAAGGSGNPFVAASAIGQLDGTTLANVTVNGVSGLTAADVPALSSLNGVLTTSQGGTGTTSLSAAMDTLTGATGAVTGAVVRLQSGAYGLAASVCSLFSNATTCAKLLGYADPRQFGAYCGSDFDVNNNTEDDAPGINAALQTGVPVFIPYPGCKIASQVKFSGNGETLFSFGGSGPYDAQLTPTEPYIFVTNDVATASPNNCAIDTQGYDGVTLRDITMLANYSKEGTVAVCNSIGIQSGLSAAFLNIDGVTISNFGDGIGGATTNTFTPTGTLQNNVFQIRGEDLNVSNSGAGMYGNFSDVHLTDTFFSSNDGPCFSTIPGYAGAIEMDNMRCEYSGTTYGGSTLQEDGTGIYLDGSNAVHLSNVICDHDYGACITIGDGSGAGSHVTLDNITSYDSDKGGSAVSNQCHYVINGASYISATNIESINRDYSAPYALCTLGHPDYITWHAVTGVAGGAAGYATAYLNLQNPITHFDFSALGLPSFVLGDNTGIDTSSPNYPLDVAGFINTDQYSGYKQAGTTILYGTSTLTSVLVGPYAGNLTFTGANNIAIGSSTLAALTTGVSNIAINNSALASLTTGSANVAIGDLALEFATSTSDNTAIGHKALLMGSSVSSNNSGSDNTAVGAFSLGVLTAGSNNTAVGVSALARDTTGGSNVAVGVNALSANWSPTSTVAIGLNAACGTSCGGSPNYNNQGGVYVGYQSGHNVGTGSDFNTFLGYQSGYANTSGTDNIFIGPQPNTSGAGYITTGGNDIGIGFNPLFPSATASNQLNIGNFIFGTGLTATSSATTLPSSLTGDLGIGTSSPDARLTVWGPDTASTSAFVVSNSASTTEFAVYDTGNAALSGSLTQNSDERLKTNVQSLDPAAALTAIDTLNPVSFDWIDGIFGSGDQLGFIAQAVQDVFPQLVSTTSPTALTPDGTLGLNYSGLIAPIVGAIQALASEITSLEQTVAGFAESFSTRQLCIVDDNGSTCITRAQLAAILANQGGDGSSGQGTAPSDTTSSISAATDTPPVIQVNGDNPAIVQVGVTYNDLGATITGPQADLNLGIQTFLNGISESPIQLDTSEPATDTIDYVVTDGEGNTSTSTRTVIIQAPSDPTATSTNPN